MFCVEDWLVDPSSDRLRRGDEAIKLEPKVMSLLIYLAKRPGRLITRAELEENVWSGVVVGYDTVTGAIQKLRKALRDDAHNPRIIETIPKKGYRFLASVQPLSGLNLAPSARPTTPPPAYARRTALWAGLTLLFLAIFVGWWWPWKNEVELASPRHASLPSDEKPAIAVLPFINMSSDHSQEYFSDGMTEDLITDLSRISGLFVIARFTTFGYKGSKKNIQQIARELGVSHVLTGSVQKVDNRIRINAQLIEANTKRQVWADRYDRNLSDVFALQDEITKRIVSALSIKLGLNEKVQLSRSAKVIPEAYDMLLRGIDRYRRLTKDAIIESRKFFERAIALDPKFARAHADLALTYTSEANLGLTDSPEATLRKALEIAKFSLKLDKSVPQVHFVMAAIYRAQKQFDKALAAARQTVALDPNYADGYFQIALNLNYVGKPRDGLSAIKKAMQLNPRHPFFYVLVLGQSYYLLGRYNEALALFERAKKANPRFAQAHKFLAVTYEALGRKDDAAWEVEELKALIPGISLKKELFSAPFKDRKILDLYISRLRKAGLE